MPVLSVIIPAYNEERYIGTLLERIFRVNTEALGFSKEVIVVNDGSTDATAEIASSFPGVKCITQPNQGKGRAVRTGIEAARGDFVLIQDADLEYDPQDYLTLLGALQSGAQVVYGSRILGQLRNDRGRWRLTPGRHPSQGVGPWLAGILLSAWTFLLYGRWLTDTLTAYKLYPTKMVRSLSLRTRGFETDHEITAKLLRRGVRIVEVPISYYPRSRSEGKKIAPKDGFIALWTLLRYRLID